jgi:hypothetical protein
MRLQLVFQRPSARTVYARVASRASATVSHRVLWEAAGGVPPMAGAWRAGLLKGVHELRFAFCQTSEASEGVRCVRRRLPSSEAQAGRATGRQGAPSVTNPMAPPHKRRLTHSACVWCSKFITTHYKALKAANPELPVLLRECTGTEARLTARFGASLRRAPLLHVSTPPLPLLRADTRTARRPLQTKAARLASP